MPADLGNLRQMNAGMFAAPIFVLLWSTGFIGAKYGLPYAEPLTFLSVRFACATGLLVIWIWVSKSPWPERRHYKHLAVVGILLHAGYLGGVFCAISLGLEAGVSALIVSLQPILTAIIAGKLIGERVGGAHWLGLGLGFAGVLLVVWDRVSGAGAGDVYSVGLCILALIAITLATLYQRRFLADAPMRSGAAIQYVAAFAVLLPISLATETQVIDWTAEFIFALLWLTIILSLGAIGLLLFLLSRSAASSVASLMFLVPPSTAIIAWAMFDEPLGPRMIIGLILAASGVALVTRNAAAKG